MEDYIFARLTAASEALEAADDDQLYSAVSNLFAAIHTAGAQILAAHRNSHPDVRYMADALASAITPLVLMRNKRTGLLELDLALMQYLKAEKEYAEYKKDDLSDPELFHLSSELNSSETQLRDITLKNWDVLIELGVFRALGTLPVVSPREFYPFLKRLIEAGYGQPLPSSPTSTNPVEGQAVG